MSKTLTYKKINKKLIRIVRTNKSGNINENSNKGLESQETVRFVIINMTCSSEKT